MGKMREWMMGFYELRWDLGGTYVALAEAFRAQGSGIALMRDCVIAPPDHARALSGAGPVQGGQGYSVFGNR